jgi:ABC-type transport system substrate-binding protein
MQRFLLFSLALLLLAASCASQSVTTQAELSTASVESAPARAPEIRFALVGKSHDVNSWALFDEQGATYADYALRFEYLPRLYHLAPPDFSFQPLAARGLPADFVQEGEFYSATVNLRPDLKWTDASPFTAEDVAFTVNTALDFELGLDWYASYPYAFLARAEVVEPYVVKFVFKQKPDASLWQYGALQGPIVQKNFWQARIAKARTLLPEDSSSAEVEQSRAYLARVQYDVDDLTFKLQSLSEVGRSDRELYVQLMQRNLELGYAKNNLSKALEQYQSKINAAKTSLYQIDDKNEPTLGGWIFESQKGDVWVNAVNPDFPFGKPNFDRAVYRLFDDEKDALAAFDNDEVDFILAQNGLSHDVENAEISATYSARFLVFNPLKTQFADPAFRGALSCMIDREYLSQSVFKNKTAPLHSFVISPQWKSDALDIACAGMDKSARVKYALKLLTDAGYSWAKKPDTENAGKTLFMKNGEAFPKIVLSAPSQDADPLRYIAAKHIAEQAQYLGIPLSVREMNLDDVVYAVYSSQKYDAALVGWRLSEYPSYLCKWFGGHNPYTYRGSRFASTCNTLQVETNLDAARQFVHNIESELMRELPFIPLFTLTQVEIYRNLEYPSQSVINGWGSLYGAPSYAVPAR